ncbi:leukocyte tyrosine kinase receptor isoform X2 [Diachasmimorpha longicaudata]|uniref:leukocyte tyrosine kinase receptor isoform X2 n=1 Tax=Diachasmimorpha longicaudata TaxID=58733 RepID=UPI0030B917A6
MAFDEFLVIVFCGTIEAIGCRREHGVSSSGQRFLLKLLLILCCVIGAHCAPLRGIKELQTALHEDRVPPPFLGHCDFERPCRSWTHRQHFQKITPGARRDGVPKTDANDNPKGHFLWLRGLGEGQIWSVTIPPTGAQCFLEFATYQIQMHDGVIRLIIETNNDTSSVAAERFGNDDAKWNITRLKLGVISQPYRVGLEIGAPANGSISIDNIRLDDCFPESKPLNTRNNCTPDMFRCNNGSCLNKTRVCDLTPDCSEGEDEILECDKIPETAKCNFENGWCGWTNAPDSPLKWSLHRGSTPSERTGPSYDHTYRNDTGTYAFVNSSRGNGLGDRATLNSPIFNPTPPYSSDPKSPYYQSCQVRFFFHQYGAFSGSLGLYLVQMKPHQNQSHRLWWSYGDRSDIWYNHALALPEIRYKYFLQFEASKSFAATADIAVDDFSLSPECFGIVIRVTTCGAVGRYGPTLNQCAMEYNGSELDSQVFHTASSTNTSLEEISNFHTIGLQKWIVPRGGYYTLIATGARGGRGSGGMGSTLGALARGVIELEKGQTLYFLVGQPGADACTKSLGRQNPCTSITDGNESPSAGMSSFIREVKKIKLTHGGGGGGGGTFIFTLKPSGELEPILIAAGGGGLGFGKFTDDGIQHGHPPSTQMNQIYGFALTEKAGGAGGGWNTSSTTDIRSQAVGKPLTKGGLGGKGCHERNNSLGFGDGGFGGGGGGCRTGGGGGGYIGGTTGVKSSANGEGGYSYGYSELLHVYFKGGLNPGPGEVFIIPAISGCGCDFRCVAVDRHLSETRCLCPPGWQLGNDSRSCLADEVDSAHQTFMIILVAVCLTMFFAFSGLCLILYNRYQNRKALQERRQNMFGNGTELAALQTLTTENMMTEFNPNYEFAGNLYSIKDLPQIPRETITCVKPLGQGAFGEVFQGVYKFRRNEEAQIAVKTLPTVTTSQAAADFMMEALIMSKFDHPNIVKFIGISFDKNPRYIVLELLAGGDLKNFLREERPRSDRATNLTMRDLVVCAHDVASGCKYMEDARFIHRDIAARNCLLTCKGPGRVVKIADFGMARDIYRSDYYRKGGKAMLPIKWMPPESFLDGIFSTKTDVWAFGVLLWEIMSFGYMPYTGCANREVMSMVTTGGRLEKPAGCPDPLYGIMARCWHPRPEDRPSFATIVERLGYCLQDPDVINHPMPNYDILPDCDREITIMRPDPEAECINVNNDLDRCGYMQPRSNFRPAAYRIGVVPGIVYASLRHCDDFEGETIQETTLVHPKELEVQSANTKSTTLVDKDSPMNFIHLNNEENMKHKYGSSLNDKKDDSSNSAQCNNIPHKHNSAIGGRENSHNVNGESNIISDTNSDSIAVAPPTTRPDTVASSPNTRNSSPSHRATSPDNVNGLIKKSALKAALSLDPSALYRGTIPYEKIAFPSPASGNTATVEMRQDSLGHELPREEECSC